jgi:uncharacterized membrane protein YfcA
LPELLDPTLGFACALVALAAVVRGFSGFGSAMIVMPGLSLIYPPVETLVVFALIELAANLQLLPQGLRDADRRRVLPLALGATLCLPLGWQVIVAVGCASGLLGGSTGMAGPPVILMLMSTPGSAAQVRGALILFFAWLGLVFLALFAWEGRLDVTALLRAAVLLPFYLAGIWAGSRLFRRSGERHFRWAALAILAAVAVAALVA